jgi:uncharacterized protein YdhG (YjbR/CyaY superfamily)
MAVKTTKNTKVVDEYMEKLDHPLKAGVEVLREAIKGVNKDIIEEVKWNAPSYHYKDYIATFNLRDKSRIHLVFHNPMTPKVNSTLLEGNYTDGRRMAYFANLADVEVKKTELARVVQELVKMMDEEN